MTTYDAAMTAELIVERTAHLEALGEALACAERRRGRCILLAGEAGSGKSALVGRFLDGLPRRVDVVSATCQDMSTPLPLAPLYDIARALGGAVQEAVRNGADHRALFETLLEQMTEARHPTVMVLEDVHWADEASLDLLRFLIRRLAGVPLLALVTFRDVEIGEQLQRLLGELAAAPDVRRLGVAALSLDGVAALAPGADPRYIAEIHRRSGGNAFFVGELLSQADRSAVPMTVQDAVLPRLSRLDPATRAAAELAAVVGDPAEITLLERLGCAAADIDECLGSGFLVDRGAGRVGFRHDIVRETVAAAIPAARRRALHAGILAAFDDRTHPARLVEHAVAAGDSAAITRWAPIAAERAQDVGAIRQAAELLRLAIEAGTEHDALAELARRRGLLLGDLGEFEVSLRVLET
ncbi:MAG: hypothetical protein QOI15_3082, partial [Pseudonocardiales bacterium]|nr:hypothetical protein [Pseudonocardiales bacterium]